MVDEVKGHGQEPAAPCLICVYWRAAGCLGARCTRIIGPVMEGVHEEFRLALRENKWEARPKRVWREMSGEPRTSVLPRKLLSGSPSTPSSATEQQIGCGCWHDVRQWSKTLGRRPNLQERAHCRSATLTWRVGSQQDVFYEPYCEKAALKQDLFDKQHHKMGLLDGRIIIFFFLSFFQTLNSRNISFSAPIRVSMGLKLLLWGKHDHFPFTWNEARLFWVFFASAVFSPQNVTLRRPITFSAYACLHGLRSHNLIWP